MEVRTILDTLKIKAQKIKWIVVDVDGVLTNGDIFFSSSGETIQAFNVKDGLALVIAKQQGLNTAFLSSRNSRAVSDRAEKLGINEIMLGVTNKKESFLQLLEKHQITLDEITYMGDDLIDIPVLEMLPLSFAPADAAKEVKNVVTYVTKASGGKGAVREMIEIILKSQGKWPY